MKYIYIFYLANVDIHIFFWKLREFWFIGSQLLKDSFYLEKNIWIYGTVVMKEMERHLRIEMEGGDQNKTWEQLILRSKRFRIVLSYLCSCNFLLRLDREIETAPGGKFGTPISLHFFSFFLQIKTVTHWK